MIVDENLTDLEMKPDPFGDDIPHLEPSYREDKECPSIDKKNKFYRSILIRSHSFCCHFIQDVAFGKVNSVQDACAKCFEVYI